MEGKKGHTESEDCYTSDDEKQDKSSSKDDHDSDHKDTGKLHNKSKKSKGEMTPAVSTTEGDDEDSDSEKKKKKKKKKGKKGRTVKQSSSDQETSSSAEEVKDDPEALKRRVDDVLASITEGATRRGLTSEEAAIRKERYGPNSLPKKKESLLLKFLYFFWNPLAWAMEFAALLSFILVDYADGLLICALLLLNACIGFYEDYSSGNAIEALQKQLAPACKCLRDGEIRAGCPSVDLVPGDVVLLRLGDVIPADCYLLDDGDTLKIDQASLTGESLPVDRYPGDEIYSGSIVKQGEMMAVVHATGMNTFYGSAAKTVAETQKKSHIHIVLKSIGYFCIFFIVVGVIVELIVQFAGRDKPCTGVSDGKCAPLNNILVLVVGGLPIAMPTVLSVTMALGASALAKKKAIVSRLTAVEEIAGMEILCSDKTGTLTKNELTVKDPIAYVGELDHVIFDAALASKPENGDAIDIALVEFCNEEQQQHLKQYKLLHFHPFDPINKRTIAKMESPDGEIFHAAKGAPQVILNISENKKQIRKRVLRDIETLGKAGYRTLGVAVGDNKGKKWTMTGLIPLFDPPRDDTKDMIKKTEELGVGIKMITGDHLTIAKETAKMLGMGSNIFPAELMKDEAKAREETGLNLDEIVNKADGFAQVFPMDKFAIVERLQRGRRLIGMTGDGVNDAPALKKANIGIAVADSTDAARSASDIVLTKEGLSVIVDAIVGSRKIFQRMKNYCMYSISVCVRVVLTFGILTIAFDWYFPTIACVLLAIFNDGSMLSISKDKVKPSQIPDTWNLPEIFGTAIALGSYLSASTIVLYILAVDTSVFHDWFGIDRLAKDEARGLIYLQVSVSGLATVFVTRTHGFSWMIWKERPGLFVVSAFVVAQIAATILGAYGLNGFPDDGETDFKGSGWGYVLIAWIWCLIWYIPMDFIKFAVRSLMKGEIKLFHHKFSIHFQLVHGYQKDHPGAAADKSGYESHVVTMEDLSNLKKQLKHKIKRRIKLETSEDETATETDTSEGAYLRQEKKSKKKKGGE